MNGARPEPRRAPCSRRRGRASFRLLLHESAQQLHQLRGRIGRGPWKSHCILLTAGRLGEDAQRRIYAMVQTHDGIRIADADLALRGPGALFGTRPSGLPALRAASPGAFLPDDYHLSPRGHAACARALAEILDNKMAVKK